MKQELVRINSTDGIEQVGILYIPEENTKKIVIHVHGLNGNFYENRFIDTLAETYTDMNYTFLTFNNRGVNFITELLKGDEFVTIGGSLENFKECVLDIEGVVNWVKEREFTEIILEGHSYGCNKVVYYYNKRKDDLIKKLILLAPCDIPSTTRKFLTEEEYKIAKEESTRLVNEGKGEELINYPVMANEKIAARTFFNDFLPNGENDFFRYREGIGYKSKVLNNIDIPVLVIYGDKDEPVQTEDLSIVNGYFINNIKNCNIEVIKDADHLYMNKFEELSKVIRRNIE